MSTEAPKKLARFVALDWRCEDGEKTVGAPIIGEDIGILERGMIYQASVGYDGQIWFRPIGKSCSTQQDYNGQVAAQMKRGSVALMTEAEHFESHGCTREELLYLRRYGSPKPKEEEK